MDLSTIIGNERLKNQRENMEVVNISIYDIAEGKIGRRREKKEGALEHDIVQNREKMKYKVTDSSPLNGVF